MADDPAGKEGRHMETVMGVVDVHALREALMWADKQEGTAACPPTTVVECEDLCEVRMEEVVGVASVAAVQLEAMSERYLQKGFATSAGSAPVSMTPLLQQAQRTQG